MSRLTIFPGMQSEIFVPITPAPVWTPVTKPLNEMTVALATAAGVHMKNQERFNLSGDSTWRKIKGNAKTEDMMVSHGGYDNSDVNKDINCMFPLDRLRELEAEGFIGRVSPIHAGFMGGGGDVKYFTEHLGPDIGKTLKEAGVDAVVMTAG